MIGSGFAPAYANSSKIPSVPSHSIAFWVWTPETNKWINPKYAVKDTPQEQLEVGLSFYESKEYKEAIREFKKLIKHYPRALQAPEAQYHIGLCLEEQEAIFKAFKEYQVVIDQPGGMAAVHVKLEPVESLPAPAELARRVRALIRDRLFFNAKVTLVEPGALPRFELKAQRFIRP